MLSAFRSAAVDYKEVRELQLTLIFLGIIAQALFVGPPIYNNVGPAAIRTDFLSFYTGPRLLAEGKLYDAAAAEAMQFELGRRQFQDPVPFIRLPFYAHALSPLKWFPYDVVHAAWLVGMVVAYAGSVIWLHSLSSHAAVMGAWFLPMSFSLLRSQDPPLFLLFAAAASVLLARQRQIGAGLVMAACAIKWHFLLFVPLYILVRREWRFGAGFVTGLAVLLIWSFALVPGWPWQYFELILHPTVTPHPVEMPNLRGLFGQSRPLLWTSTAVVAAAVALAIRKLQEDLPALHIAFLGALLTVGHSYIADCVILLPLLAMLSQSQYMSRWIARVIAFPALLPLLVVGHFQFVPQLALAALPVLLAVELTRSRKAPTAG